MIGIKEITSSIKNMVELTLRKPANVISGIIMACALAKRPGLSCLLSYANVVQEISKKGIPTENLPDGTPNLMNQMINSVICEVYRALKEDANIQITLPMGSIRVSTNGANAGGPVVSTGTNINYSTGNGLLQ